MGAEGRRSHILLVEDNVVNQRVASGLLTRRGHHVTVAQDGREALARLDQETFDLVLMDLQMPVMGGLDATAAIRLRERSTGQHLRIVAMTAHAMSSDRERCLAAGMDGYLAKPFYMVELLARVEALLRRLGDVRTTKLSVDDLEMDLIERTVFRGGKKIDLLPRELKLLEYFLRHHGQVVTREMLLKDVWQHDLGMETNVVDAHISNLRRKIDDHGLPSRIANVRKLGYMLRARAP